MNPATLAAGAVAVLETLWDAGAAEVAKSAGKDLYGWLKGKLAGPPAEALRKLEAEPQKERHATRLLAELEEALEKDPALAQELAPRLEAGRAAGVAMTLTQTGTGNIGVQASGSKVEIQR